MYGAIIGDSAGSIYEYNQINKVKEVKINNLIESNSFYSDDTILTIAIMDAMLNDKNFELKVNLPSTLEYIGDGSMAGAVYEITIPKSVKQIGNTSKVFVVLAKITFEGAEDNTSNLGYIGNEAFSESILTEVIIPSSVISIGDKAFYSNSLTKVTFKTNSDGTNSLRNIGQNAFAGNILDYQDRNNPLVIPSTVTYIGDQAFWTNDNLKFIKYTGSNLSSFASEWYGGA